MQIALGVLVAFAASVSAQDTTAAPDSMAAPAAAPAPSAAPATLSVEAVLTSNVIDRAPRDTVSSVPADVGSLTLWTRVTGGNPGTVIHHVWFRGDEQVGDVQLQVNGSPWRTWSRKAIPAEWTGQWRVEIRDHAGNVLQRIEFTVG
jgi:hypothetical protein